MKEGVIVQLIRIETTPMKYEIRTEPARLEMQDAIKQASSKVEQRAARLDIQTKNIQVQLDSYQMRRDSFNLKSSSDFAKDSAQKGAQNIKDLISDTINTSKQLGHLEDGVTIGQIIRQKTLEHPTTPYTLFLPNGGTEISWIPNSIEKSYTPPEMNTEWYTAQRKLSYIPGSFSINIIQYAEVNIEYLGSPMYVPPSAAPNYEETAQ